MLESLSLLLCSDHSCPALQCVFFAPCPGWQAKTPQLRGEGRYHKRCWRGAFQPKDLESCFLGSVTKKWALFESFGFKTTRAVRRASVSIPDYGRNKMMMFYSLPRERGSLIVMALVRSRVLYLEQPLAVFLCYVLKSAFPMPCHFFYIVQFTARRWSFSFI